MTKIMTQVYFHDLEALGHKIQEYTKEMNNYRALIEGREMLAKGLRAKYPNMKIEVIRDTLWKQEQEQAKKAHLAQSEMQLFALSCGWELHPNEVTLDIMGLIRKKVTSINNIKV